MAKTSDGAQGQPQFASSGNPPDFADDLSLVSTFFAARAFRQFSTVANLLASTGSPTDSYAIASNAPGGLFQKAASGWLMHGVAKFASASARNTAMAAPGTGWRTRRDDATYDEVYNGTAWVPVRPLGWVPVSPTLVTPSTGTATTTLGKVVTSLVPASLRLDNIFADNFDKYRLIAVVDDSANTGMGFQFVTGTTPDATASYDFERALSVANATTAPVNNSGSTSASLGTTNNRPRARLELNIERPKRAVFTTFSGRAGYATAAAGGAEFADFFGQHRANTAFDGILITNVVGTGLMEVYIEGFNAG